MADEVGFFSETIEVVHALLQNTDWLYSLDQENAFNCEASLDDSVRRKLALAILKRIVADRIEVFHLANPLGLVKREIDLGWLVDCLDLEDDPAVREMLARLMFWIANQNEESQFEAIWDVQDRYPEFTEIFLDIIGPIPLDSAHARSLRRQLQYARQAPAEKPDLSNQTSEDAAKIARSSLIEAREGTTDAWWRFVQLLSIFTDEGEDPFQDRGFSASSIWKHLNPSDRGQITPAAKHYIAEADPALSDWWFTPDARDWRSMAGYNALEYLLKADPAALEALPANVWAKWSPAIINFKMYDEYDEESRAPCEKLASICYRAGPVIFVHRVRERVRAQLQGSNCRISFRQLLKGCWEEEIARLVGETTTRLELHHESLAEALLLLLDHDDPFGFSIVKASVENRIRGERQVSALVAFLARGNRDAWKDLWPHLSVKDDLALRILKKAFDDEFVSGLALDTEELADLFLLVNRVLPPETEPNGGRVSRLRMTANNILRRLARLGTEAACQALVRIQNSRADLEWVSTHIIQCRENLRRNRWTPPTPQTVIELATDRDKRFVRSGSDLLSTLVESLKRFEADLHGQQPTRGNIWNTVTDNYRPKSENEISDVIITHLRRDLGGRGIIANREVELRPDPGERTDIHVDAISFGDRSDIITAIVEVKGCWNRELTTAMGSQLVSRYLTDSGIFHGIYLVAWFLCPRWTDKDFRRGDTEKLSWDLETAKKSLAQQATDLSTYGRAVRAFVFDGRWPEKTEKPANPRRKTRPRAVKTGGASV